MSGRTPNFELISRNGYGKKSVCTAESLEEMYEKIGEKTGAQPLGALVADGSGEGEGESSAGTDQEEARE